jgi:hypothetical protein
MIKPELNYNLIQVCREVDGVMEVTYRIVNADNETILEFTENEGELAYKLWWVYYLTPEERDIWEQYELHCEVAAECAQEDLWSRINRC